MQRTATIIAIVCLLFLSLALALRERRNSAQRSSPPTFSETLSVENRTTSSTMVNVSFGAASEVSPANWGSFCKETSRLNCQFPLPAKGSLVLPTLGRRLNATFFFDGSGCGVTKAELDINNPAWFNIYDISLVDGYSNKILMTVTPTGGTDAGAQTLGPPAGKDGNENVFGLYPYGCDICVARLQPPCGIPSGGAGCKAGTQYNPKVPCQFQGDRKGGGQVKVVIALVP